MAILNWKLSPDDSKLVTAIAKRAVIRYRASDIVADPLNIEMDLTAVHNNGTPLRLKELLAADNFNLMHDIGGIARHINRDTGQLEDFFVPRFAA